MSEANGSETRSASFVDRKGKEWSIEFDLDLCRRLKETIGIDFGDLQGGKAFLRLATDHEAFGAMLWLFCEEQAGAAGIDEIAFAKRIGGDALEGAQSAIVQAVINFTRPSMRDAVRAVIAETMAVELETWEATKESIREIGQSARSKAREQIAEAMRQQFGT